MTVNKHTHESKTIYDICLRTKRTAMYLYIKYSGFWNIPSHGYLSNLLDYDFLSNRFDNDIHVRDTISQTNICFEKIKVSHIYSRSLSNFLHFTCSNHDKMKFDKLINVYLYIFQVIFMVLGVGQSDSRQSRYSEIILLRRTIL
mgnify:CR=1 FL=1